MSRLFFVSVLLVSLMASPLRAEDAPVVIYEKDPTLLTTTVSVVVLTGTLDDPAPKRGLANLLGEMLLRGTKTKTRSEFQSQLERLGATLSVATSDDMTVFNGQVIKENTEAFLTLLEEALFRPRFDSKEFTSLKREVLNEISHMKNSNTRLAGLALRKELFAGTPFEAPGTGTLSTVRRVTLQDVVKTYNTQFHRGNFIFGVASPTAESKLKKRLTDLWKKFPEGKRNERGDREYKMPAAPTLVLVHKPKTSTGSLYFGQPGITAKDPLRFALDVGNFSFGSEPLVSRLFRTVRAELGYTYAIGTTYQALGPLSNQTGLFVITSTPTVEYTTKTIMKILEMWGQYMSSGLEKQELSLAQDSLVNSYPFEFDSAQKRLWQRVRSEVYGVPILSPAEYEKTIRGVSNNGVKAALAERHKKSAWVIALVADKDEITKQLAEAQKGVPPSKQLKISKVLSPDSLIQ